MYICDMRSFNMHMEDWTGLLAFMLAPTRRDGGSQSDTVPRWVGSGADDQPSFSQQLAKTALINTIHRIVCLSLSGKKTAD